ncbi:MAG: redox-sensing transcriptional repressor Rex [Alkalispirochaeta sp.]
METKINRGIVLRLAKYLRVLHKLKSLGFVKVFSNNLGDAIGVTPAVVRKDFSTINIPGNKRGGYNIDVIVEEIEKVLGKEERQRVVVIGCGKIGQALMTYPEFGREGIEVVAGFDVDPEVIHPSADIPILPMEEFAEFVGRRDIKVAVLAVPDGSATEVFERITDAGIPGVLNFTSVELKCTKCDFENCPVRCVVQNVNIGLEIENLFYLVRMKDSGVLEDNRPRESSSAESHTQAG